MPPILADYTATTIPTPPHPTTPLHFIIANLIEPALTLQSIKVALPFDPLEWPTSNFSSQPHPWITYEGHKNKRNDHQLKKLLIVKQILLVDTLRKSKENSTENIHTDVGV